MRFGHGFRRFTSALAVVSLTCFSMTAVPAFAAGEPEVYASYEYFTWKESDDTGSQILKESGPRYAVGFAYTHTFENHITIEPRIEFIGGTVDFNGQACYIFGGTCIPDKTDTDYYGFKFEMNIGGKIGSNVTAEPFGGLGVRTWDRNINNTLNARGAATGYTERWLTFYGRAGMRAYIDYSQGSRLFFEAGMKLPVSTKNHIYDANISREALTLEPKNKASFFAEAGVKFHVFKISVFYDSMKFNKSDTETQYDPFFMALIDYTQPKSDSDMYGIRVGASF